MTFPGRSKKNYDVAEEEIENALVFFVFMLPFFITWVLRYAAHT